MEYEPGYVSIKVHLVRLSAKVYWLTASSAHDRSISATFRPALLHHLMVPPQWLDMMSVGICSDTA